MNLDHIRSRLDGVRGSGQSFQAKCPAHDDKTPSLSVSDKGDRIVLHCHAGCSPREVLEAIGMTWDDVFESSERKFIQPTLRVSERRRLARSYAVEFEIARLAETKQTKPSDAQRVLQAVQRLCDLATRYGLDEFEEIAKSWEDGDCYFPGPEVRKYWPLSGQVKWMLRKERERG